jgi:phospho-N-acetylmuramoyl-pentapeptide-transferase
MILLLLQKFFLLNSTGTINVSVRMMLAAITTLIMTIFLGPFFIRKLYEMKIGQTIRSEKECPVLADLHKKKKNTPTMGGVLILFSMVVSLFLWMDLTNIYTWILLLTTVWLGVVGGIDDYYKLKYKNSKGIRPRIKLFWQLLLAVILALVFLWGNFTNVIIKKTGFSAPIAKEVVEKRIKYRSSSNMKVLDSSEYMSRIYIPFCKKPIKLNNLVGRIFIFLFIVFVILGSSNAVNLTDGLDGLAAGLIILVAAVFAFIAFLSNHIEMARYLNILYIEKSGEIAVYLFAMVGASLGFLWYNSYPAQLFMGDTGSLALGGILGVSTILLKKEVLLAIVGAIFVAEAVSVIMQVLSYRYRNKKRIFLCSPLHHHFEYKGWAETKVVIRFWIIGLLCAIIGISSLRFQL